MKYVALLRGINVGGNAKVEMKRLKVVFEELGYTDVKTYINSGNVIFETTDKQSTLDNVIEKAIKKEFNLAVPVVVRSQKEIVAIEKEVPKTWLNNTEMKTDVLFLWDEYNKKEVLKDIGIKPEIDTVKYVHGALVWNVKRKDVTRSGLLKIIGTPFYKKVTIRNINTLRKLHQLMQADK
ncbi:MAG: DUF1697 domain-containing protein [Weeksellaceae bacterium]